MGYGLRVRDALGGITLDTSDIVGRIRYSTVVSAGTSDSIVLPDIDGKTTILFSIPVEGDKIAHSISRSGTIISWAAQSFTLGAFSTPSSDSLIGVILVD